MTIKKYMMCKGGVGRDGLIRNFKSSYALCSHKVSYQGVKLACHRLFKVINYMYVYGIDTRR